MTYPESAGWKGDTGNPGHQAALDYNPKLQTREAEAFAVVRALGVASAVDVANRTGRHWAHVKPRLSAMKVRGILRVADTRGRTEFGRPATRYRLPTPDELAADLAAKEAEGRAND